MKKIGDIEELQKIFKDAIIIADIYLQEVRPVDTSELTYKLLFDEKLAIFNVNNNLYGRKFKDSIDDLKKELMKMKSKPDIPTIAVSVEKYLYYYNREIDFIMNILKKNS